MYRLFCALTLPVPVARRLAVMGGGIPGARWVAAENLHITIRFIGEVDGRSANAAHEALRAVRFFPFEVKLQNIETFGERKPRLLYAGIASNDALQALYVRVNAALARAGLPMPDEHRYVPHVTLARLNRAPRDRLGIFIAANNILDIPPFQAENFVLMSSHKTAQGSSYQIEFCYPEG